MNKKEYVFIYGIETIITNWRLFQSVFEVGSHKFITNFECKVLYQYISKSERKMFDSLPHCDVTDQLTSVYKQKWLGFGWAGHINLLSTDNLITRNKCIWTLPTFKAIEIKFLCMLE